MVGRVGQKTGFNAYELRTTGALYYATRATVRLVQKKGHQLTLTQDHYSMEGRALVREGTVEDYNKNPGFAKAVWMDADIGGRIGLRALAAANHL